MPKTTKTHKARKHHPYSPSKLQVFECCPKFKAVEGTNSAAERGQAMHESSETLDFSGLTTEESNAVHSYLDYINIAKSEMEGCTELVEVRVAIDPKETTAGFLDRALISADGTYAHLIDLKTGFGDVEDADNNLQGMAYALGLRRLYPTLRRIKVSFVMPRQAKFKSVVEFTAEELDESYRRIVSVVARAKKAKRSKDWAMAEAHTGVCRFCAYAGNGCPKAEKPLAEFSKHQPVEIFTLQEMMVVDDPVKMGKVLDFLKYIDECAKPIKARITEIAKSGGDVGGYGLSCISEREVVDTEAACRMGVDALVEQGKDRDEALALVKDCFTLSLPALDAALSEAAPRGFKIKAKQALRKTMTDAGAIRDSSPKVFLKRGREADPLPPVLFMQGGNAFDATLTKVSEAPVSQGSNGIAYLD